MDIRVVLLLLALSTTLISVVMSVAPGDEDQICSVDLTDTLLDSRGYVELLSEGGGVWTTVATLNSEVITNDTAWTSGGAQCMQSVQSCVNGTDPNRANWVLTQFIHLVVNGLGTEEIDVRIRINFTSMCPLGDAICRSNLNLRVFHTSTQVGNEGLDLSNFQLVSVVNSMEEFVIRVRNNEGFYLALQDSGTCVSVSNIRVFFIRCPADTINFVEYPESFEGLTANGTCVSKSAPSGTLEATCTGGSLAPVAGSMCSCQTGIEGSENQCSACSVSYFPISAPCQQCPTNSERVNSAATECTCMDNRSTASGTITTTGDSCNGCTMDFFLSGDSCVSCPLNSENTDPLSTICTCSEGRGVADGENIMTTTSLEDCTACRLTHFGDSSGCSPCPMNSRRNFPVDVSCTCLDNSVTEGGELTTTADPCTGCRSGYLRTGSGVCELCPVGSGNTNPVSDTCICTTGLATSTGMTTTSGSVCNECREDYYNDGSGCIRCPASSGRTFDVNSDDFCPCNENYLRKDESDASLPCLPIVGFNQSTVTFDEGSSTRSEYVQLFLSVSANIEVSVTSFMGPPSTVTFSSPSMQANVLVEVEGNELALQEDLLGTIVVNEGEDYIVGSMPPFYGQVVVTIAEDDMVDVGFNESMRTFNQSNLMGFVFVEKIGQIADAMEIRVIGGDSSLGTVVDTNVIFMPDGPDVLRANFNFVRQEKDELINLRLEVVSPAQFAVSQIRIGASDSGLESNLRLVLKDDFASPAQFPVTIVVASVAGAIGALLILVVFLLICVCICKWSVSRQGYYATYEDKASEPPSMLRYSASLRSISSQTVVPAADGRGAAGIKEHEFYV